MLVSDNETECSKYLQKTEVSKALDVMLKNLFWGLKKAIGYFPNKKITYILFQLVFFKVVHLIWSLSFQDS